MPVAVALNLLVAFIDPQWAIPLNTFLLFVMTVENRRHGKRAEEAASTATRAVARAEVAVARVEKTVTDHNDSNG